MKRLMNILIVLVVGYVLICAVVYFNQDRMLFFPSVVPMTELEPHARQIGLERWTNSRGEYIGWKSPDDSSKDALLFCHGNGGLALSQGHAELRHTSSANFQVFLLEYPGYGARPGKISTQALTEAAIDAIDTLSAERPDRRIWLFGESLGSGIVSAAAAARPDKISGIVLDTPFDSLSAAASSHYPWLPVRLLMRHRLDSDKNLQKFHGPVAFVVAGDDTTIPPRHAQRLYGLYAGPKKLWLVPGAGHNSFDELMQDWPQIAGWLTTQQPR